MFLKNRNIIFKMKISKVTDYAALNMFTLIDFSIRVDRVIMELSPVYFKESRVEI